MPAAYSPPKPRPAIDIVCRVVDYFGDAGIGWRLTRELARAHGFETCLWIDRPDIVGSMAPAGEPHTTVRPLEHFEARYRPREVLMTTFDSRISDPVRQRIARDGDRTLRVHFEYLSAEPWIDGCHGLAALKSDGSREWMFLPGFTSSSGGLLRERDLAARRAAHDRSARDALLRALGVPASPGHRISLFCYPQAPADDWFAQLAAASEPVCLLAAHGVAHQSACRFFGADPAPGAQACRGALTLHRLPFLSQDDYDRLLWSCELNLVRGEDSWIRAHWAHQAFVWQPYIQPDAAHLAKLDAFLDRLTAGASPPVSQTLRRFAHAWSGDGSVAASWPDFAVALPAIAAQCRRWALELESQTDCCTRLAGLIRERLQ